LTTSELTSTRVTFAVITAGVTTYAVLQCVVIPVLPLLQRSLHTSQAGVTWVLTANLLSAAVCTPIAGRAGDIVGRKRVFVLSLAVLAAGSVLAALATTLPVMVVARLIQGAGGGVLPLAFGIVRDEFPAEQVAGAIGKLASILAAAAGFGLVLAGPLVGAVGLRGVFLIPGLLVALAAVAARLVVPESRVRGAGRISLPPALLLSGWLVCLLLGLGQAGTRGWTSGRTLGLLAGGLVLLALWVGSERRSVAPLIDMRMLALPAVWRTNLVALFLGVGMYASFAFLPQFAQTPSAAGYGFGATTTQAGLILLPGTIVTFLLGQFSGRLVRLFTAARLIACGAAVCAGAMVLLAALHGRLWQVELAVLVNGAGSGLAFAAMASLVVQSVPPGQTGVASGMNANIRTIGGSIGAATMATVVAAGAQAGRPPAESGYTAGFALLAVTSGLAAVAAVFIPRLPAWDAGDHPAEHPQLAVVAGGTLVEEELPARATTVRHVEGV
jgi:MFS family permease